MNLYNVVKLLHNKDRYRLKATQDKNEFLTRKR